MALLQLLSEEEIGEDRARDYADVLYRIVCVGERPTIDDRPGGLRLDAALRARRGSAG